MDETPLQKCVRLADGQSALARKATACAKNGRKLTQGMIWKWLNQAKGPVPSADWVLPIEEAVERRVTRHELRGDLYPIENGTVAEKRAVA